ncbi:hypothetical protein PVAND_011983 [Polypedilum vanderplanki]|uniref:Microsomal glutathione S-transferase 1 n=1 Tax=Polypedilum vanderplanki TaxID=319348 RepID=A0A9J6CKZ3_POLVA|nr:hypothetical protein PVAND_011983 [Polypedilum vanderplanki]
MSILEILSPENEVFRAYGFWASVLVLKVLGMAVLTSMARKKKKAINNPEDRVFLKPEDQNVELTSSDPDVERVRRAHLNDLENCIPFLIISFVYVLTNPSTFIGVNLIRIGVVSRIVHSYSYLNALQPYRGYGFGITFLVMIYMSLSNILYFL